METIGADLNFLPFKPLGDAEVAILRAVGRERLFRAGEMVFNVGDPQDRLFYLEEGEMELVDPVTGQRKVPTTLGPRQFTGEIGVLAQTSVTLPMRAVTDTRTIEVDRPALLQAMSDSPELSDHLITIFTARRRRQFESGDSVLVLIGSDVDPAVRRVESFLRRNRIPFESHQLDTADGAQAANECRIALGQPAVIFGKNDRVEDPTPLKVAQRLGLDLQLACGDLVDLVIVGGGPAGVAAAVYAGAEGLDALVIEDLSIGGQAGTSSRIENYMGFPTGISGGDLVWRGHVQAMKFGTRFAMPRRVVGVSEHPRGLCVTLDGGTQVLARGVLIAAGVQYRRLPIDGLERFEGSGVYYAATEMEARFCRETEAVVIGGGNSAGQAVMYLSRAARHVHLLVRGNSLAESMSDYLRHRLEADPRISIHYESQVVGLHGDDMLRSVTLRTPDGERVQDCSALFIMVGAAPNTDWLAGMVALDSKGFVLTGREAGGASPFATSHPGIWAVGDVRSGSVKRVASSVGEGSVVVSAIWSALEAARETERREADQQAPVPAN